MKYTVEMASGGMTLSNIKGITSTTLRGYSDGVTDERNL
jgi:hypothetical protein